MESRTVHARPNRIRSLRAREHARGDRALPRGWIAAAARAASTFAFAALASAPVGCSAPPEPSPAVDVGRLSQAIFAGTVDDDDDANAGVVSIKIGGGAKFELCSGSLLAPNVVLTARHCVSASVASTVTCNELGRSGNGDHVAEDLPLSRIHIYGGPSPAYGGAAKAEVAAIVHPDGAVLCNADIALLVLDRDITDIAPLAVRLGHAARHDESVRAVGYGQNDRAVPVGTRLRKDAVRVLAVGQGVSASRTPLGTREFEVGLSICLGDSGGPALSEATGAVLGVVSRGGDCHDDFGHIYTSASGFPELFERAFALAGRAPVVEQDDPRAGPPGGESQDARPAPRGGGCAVGPRPARADAFAWLAALVLSATVLGHRRRRA